MESYDETTESSDETSGVDAPSEEGDQFGGGEPPAPDESGEPAPGEGESGIGDEDDEDDSDDGGSGSGI